MAVGALPRTAGRTRRAVWWCGLTALLLSGACFAWDTLPQLFRQPAIAAVVTPLVRLDWPAVRLALVAPRAHATPPPLTIVAAPFYRMPEIRAPRALAAAVPQQVAEAAPVPAPTVAAATPRPSPRPSLQPLVAAETLGVAGGAERALLDLRVNTVDKGTVLAYLDGDDVALDAADVRRAGVRIPDGAARGDGKVSLKALRSELRYALDDKELALNLTVDPRDLPIQRRSFAQAPRERIVYTQDASAYLNYGITVNRGGPPQGFAETAFSHGPWSLGSGFSYANGTLTRGLTNLVYDQRDRLRRWTIGDALVTTGELGGTAFLGGAAVERAFALDRYGVYHPMPGLTGTVTAPATAQIYVNGTLVATQQLQPGTFDLRDLPVPEGSSATQVVVRDALGNVQTFNGSYYFSSAVLRKGITDYAYGAGLVRAGATGRGYGAPAALARYRVGLSDALTVGGRFESGSGVTSGGPFAALRTRLGELQLSAAASRANGLPGSAYALAYGFTARRFTFATRWETESPWYANASQSAFADRVVRDWEGSFGVTTGRGAVGLTFSRQVDRDLGARANVGITAELRLGPRAHLSLNATNGSGRYGSGKSLYAGITWFTGRDGSTVTSSVASRGNGAATPVLGFSKPALGHGFGYTVDAGAGRADGSFTYQAPIGQVSGFFSRSGAAEAGALTFSGGIAAIGRRLFATQPILDGGFALLDVGVPNVAANVENRSVGRTDRRGEILVTNLVTNYGNHVGFASSDVPLDYDVRRDRVVVAPPYRGGSIVRFETQRLRVFSGRIVVVRDGVASIPRYGRLSLALGSAVFGSEIGEDGEVEFQNLVPGVYAATVEDLRDTCPFRLTIAPVSAPRVDLGTLRCVVAP